MLRQFALASCLPDPRDDANSHIKVTVSSRRPRWTALDSGMEVPHGRRRQGRYEPTWAYMLADRARSAGVDLEAALGPWRASLRRHQLELISVVTNGRTEEMVRNAQRAIDLAGLLNWCGLDDLKPVPDLRPPIDSQPVEDEELKAAG